MIPIGGAHCEILGGPPSDLLKVSFLQTIGRSSTTHGRRPCWGWTRKEVVSPANEVWGITGNYPQKNFWFPVFGWWVLFHFKTQNVFLLNNFGVSKSRSQCVNCVFILYWRAKWITFDESVNRLSTFKWKWPACLCDIENKRLQILYAM